MSLLTKTPFNLSDFLNTPASAESLRAIARRKRPWTPPTEQPTPKTPASPDSSTTPPHSPGPQGTKIRG